MINRRDFVESTIAGFVSHIATGKTLAGEALAAQLHHRKKAHIIQKSYGIQYYEKACAIWNRLSTNELPIIAKSADRAASSLKDGGKLYCQLIGGHMIRAEFRPNRPGNPNFLHHVSRNAKPEEYEAIGKRDFLLFDFPHPPIMKVHERGAFTVGIRVPYFPNKTTPRGVLAMNEFSVRPIFQNIKLLEECSDLVLTSGAPFTDGVLAYPEIPTVRACPISALGIHSIFWMLMAEIAMRQQGASGKNSSEKASEYIQLIKHRGAKVRSQLDSIDGLAKLMVESVARGARYWNYPLSGDPAGRDRVEWAIMITENTSRASGLLMSRPIELPEISQKGKPGDFVFLAGETSDVKENLDAAQAFKRAGFKVFYVGPRTEGASNDLIKMVDWHIDTFSPEREGALTIPGLKKKICPTTGVLYPLAQQVLNAQFIGHMIEANMTPLVFMGVHIIGGSAYNDVTQSILEKRGY